MKKLILLAAFVIVAGTTFGQTLQKGNLIGVHVIDVTIQPDVTYNQWKDFYVNKLIPKMNEAYQNDAKVFLLEGIRGESKNEIGLIFVFKSGEARDKYFNEDGSYTEFGEKFREKMNSVNKEAEKYEKEYSTKYTDWIVQ